MTKLGFTWYPENWWSSDSFYELEPTERYIYLECLFLMYKNNGYMKTQKTQLENRLRMTISDKVWDKVTNRFVKDEDGFTHPSVNKRLRKAISNRENGLLGGRPKTQKTQPNNPSENPPSEREREGEREGEIETFGQKSKYHIGVKKVYAYDKAKIIYDLKEYFTATNQLEQLTVAGHTKFDAFIEANPGKVFNDDGHVYNSFLIYSKENSTTQNKRYASPV